MAVFLGVALGIAANGRMAVALCVVAVAVVLGLAALALTDWFADHPRPAVPLALLMMSITVTLVAALVIAIDAGNIASIIGLAGCTALCLVGWYAVGRRLSHL